MSEKEKEIGAAMANADKVMFLNDADRKQWKHYDRGHFILFRPFVGRAPWPKFLAIEDKFVEFHSAFIICPMNRG